VYILKFILLATVFGTSTTIGILISKRYSKRVDILKQLKNGLNMFEVKIEFSFETISDIFSEIAEKLDDSVGKIFSDTVKNMNEKGMYAGKAWEKSIDMNCENLKKEDIICIKSLGKMLGKTDVDGQISQIKLVSNFLDKQISEACEDKNKNEKMYQKLGAIIGAVIVIVLI